ncbi:hypothetical protein SKAU_G00127520 [Synaphobranchus kaupii]|uniref:Reverse transcriptase domain-containing protein n=1 Tax=Synaphobranchus kaupii TaxID=118154 RepID=A0A9Q1J2N1_SYNKA|nr:hypothetical protein SKAU_G00127520 [Synaphobranchus kaupii]
MSNHVLQSCHKQLAQVFCDLFNRSLEEHIVPALWKSSIISPVPKKASPSAPRPVALTPVIMKCFERLVLSQVQQSVQSIVDPLQFAYQQNRGVDDALLTLLHLVQSHLDTTKSYIRLVFLDFSSAFNTIQPHLMAKKLLKINLNPHLILWVMPFLTDRPQWVRYKGHCNTTRTISTGSPQGSVVSPVLFTLYTDDCQSNCPEIMFIKYSDDTVIVDSSNSDDKLQSAVSQFQQWCEVNLLDLNVEKTKEIAIDFQRELSPLRPLTIGAKTVERVEEYRYLVHTYTSFQA